MDTRTIRGAVTRKSTEYEEDVEISIPFNLFRCSKCNKVYYNVASAEKCCQEGRKILVEVE